MAQNKDNYKYIDKEGRAIKDVQVCLTMDKTKFFYKTNDLSEITEVAKDTFSYYEYDPSNIDYDPDLTEEIFIVFYNSKDKCNEVTREGAEKVYKKKINVQKLFKSICN